MGVLKAMDDCDDQIEQKGYKHHRLLHGETSLSLVLVVMSYAVSSSDAAVVLPRGIQK